MYRHTHEGELPVYCILMLYRITGKFGGSSDLANLTIDRQIKNRKIKSKAKFDRKVLCSLE